MRTIAALVAVSLLASVPAFARIGETREQCVERYGEPSAKSPQRLKKSDGEAEIFKVGEMNISIEFRAGKAWRLTYAGKGLTGKSTESILAKNAEKAKWGNAKFLGVKHWIAKDSGLRAVFYDSPTVMLVLMTDAASEAEHLPRQEITKEEAAAKSKPDEDAPKKTDKKKSSKPDPLDGL